MTQNSLSVTQADRLVRHCVYMIATGKWPAGARLPSIRRVRNEWGANQVTVQRTYTRLQAMGLADSRPRSGWYVAGGQRVDRLAGNRYELENLHRRVVALIGEGTGLSALGVLRYLVEFEAIRRREEPDVAFVECTLDQARAHADEIAARFNVPVLPLTTGGPSGTRERVPHHVRRLLTSPFHLDEVRRLADPPRLLVTAVPIEMSPALADDLARTRGPIVLLERESSMADHLAADVSRLLSGSRVVVRLVDDPAAELERLLGRGDAPAKPTVLLSPRVWGSLDPAVRDHPRVRQAAFRISESAWTQVADAIGLPVGV